MVGEREKVWRWKPPFAGVSSAAGLKKWGREKESARAGPESCVQNKMACEINHALQLPREISERKPDGRRIFFDSGKSLGQLRGKNAVKVSLCTTAREWKKFEEVAEDLHGARPEFIPPFPGSIAKFLKPDSAFHRRHGEIVPMIAYRDGKPAGRIAAIVNRTHNALYGDKTGFFGFWDCEDASATARALFEAAAEVLRGKGCGAIRGPYNPSINDECGLLVEGGDRGPCIGLTWNPGYYQSLIEGEGFRRVCSMFGLDLPLSRLEPPERLGKIVARTAKRSRLILRPIHLDRLEEELKIVHEVYNCTLERNWGFVPISMDDLLSAAEDMRAIADPGMILIAEMDGENAGIALSLPNFNELLIRTKKTPRWLRVLHVAWLMKTRRIRTARQVIYGISPRFRDRGGLHAWLLYEQFVCAKARYHDAELGWVEESNREILENCLMLGAIQRRTWNIYEKSLVD